MQGEAAFRIDGWEESSYSEVEGGGKLTRVRVTKSYTGDVEGQGKLEYLMVNDESGSAEFFGLERVTGRVGDSEGSFVLRHTGSFVGGRMEQKSRVVPGSGTEGLSGLQGEWSQSAGHEQEYPFQFDLEWN